MYMCAKGIGFALISTDFGLYFRTIRVRSFVFSFLYTQDVQGSKPKGKIGFSRDKHNRTRPIDRK